jgi:hypothetical protein
MMVDMKIHIAPVITAALGLAILAGCGQAQSTSSTPVTRSVGTISGVVESYRSGDKSHLSPAAQVTVTAYRKAFPFIGPVLANGPKRVAQATTDTAGRFVLRGLATGRYYLVATSTAHWVTVPGLGATTRFVVCADCPLPM